MGFKDIFNSEYYLLFFMIPDQCFSLLSSSWESTGFDGYSSISDSIHFCESLFIAYAVMAMIGTLYLTHRLRHPG